MKRIESQPAVRKKKGREDEKQKQMRSADHT